MFNDYSIVGDASVIAICLVIGILLITSYVNHTRSLWMFVNINVSLVVASVFSIVYHVLLAKHDPALNYWVYACRVLNHIFLFNVFSLFALYITEVSGMAHKQARFVAITSVIVPAVIILVDIIRTLLGDGFVIAEDGTVIHKTNIFIIGYVFFVVFLSGLMLKIRRLVYKRVLAGFYAVMALSLIVQIGQMALNQTSLTTMTFIFPIISMLYIVHANPYNVSLGSVDTNAMENMIRSMHSRNVSFVVLSLLLLEYDMEGKEIPKELREPIRKATVGFFKAGVLFQIGNGHMVLIAPKRYNKDIEHRIDRILKFFQSQYEIFHSPYKIVIGESIDEVSVKNQYVSLIQSVESSMADNTIRRIGPEEIARFNRDEYILQELTDIFKNKNLDDPRVITYCQPVFNLRTGHFDTAEALMRLKLDQAGMVPPNHFIPLAESQGYIHVLTEIILNKTCREIRRLVSEGFILNRISVNVSVLELKDDNFCQDIIEIIQSNGIDGEKIALELTESNNEANFVIMNEKIEQLRQEGIQFYLDDFGTGYSNMERLMEIPFDIIKFDRSLMIASRTGERSEKIVRNLAHLFKDMEYTILYEGVEDTRDEDRCREMFASYLQGFKYSRPVPIGELRCFLQKQDVLTA